MISRREVVTAGVLGTLATPVASAAAETVQDDAATRKILSEIQQQLVRLTGVLDDGLLGPQTVHGSFLADLRVRFTTHLRSAGKFPDFVEIGSDVFYAIYDWHVRNNQQIQVTRISEQRFSIQWMFTQHIVRPEVDTKFIGQPFDRG